MIKATTVFEANYLATSRNIVNEGSARSSKTISLCQTLILKALSEKCVITICREKLTWLRATAYMDFINTLKDHFGLYSKRDENKSLGTYSLRGSLFRFIGAEESQKAHGMKQDYLWINEANELSFHSYRQLSMRTTKQIFLDFNPAIDNNHWIVRAVLNRDDTIHVHSTYKDNPFLEKEVINEIERLQPTPFNIAQGTADETLWKIYGLGQRAVKKGLIFSDVELTKKIPTEYKKRFYGLDFGYSNHPTALVEITLAEGNLYFNLLLYKKGLVNRKNSGNAESIEEYLEKFNIPKSAPIWGDSAEPKSITDLQLAGWNVQGTTKGPDSVNNGIDQIKQYKCYILESCTDMIKERDNYKWGETKNGELTNTPVDAFNHTWDASSYGCRMELPYSKNKYKAENAKDRITNKFTSAEEKIKMYDALRETEAYYD